MLTLVLQITELKSETIKKSFQLIFSLFLKKTQDPDDGFFLVISPSYDFFFFGLSEAIFLKAHLMDHQSGIISTVYLDLVSFKASSNWSAFSLKIAAAFEPLFRTRSVTVQPKSIEKEQIN